MDDYSLRDGRHPDYYTYRYIHPSGRVSLRLALSNRAARLLWGLGALVVLVIAIALALSLAWGQSNLAGPPSPLKFDPSLGPLRVSSQLGAELCGIRVDGRAYVAAGHTWRECAETTMLLINNAMMQTRRAAGKLSP